MDAVLVATVALVARLGVVVWAKNAFGPAADGTYYDIVAKRIADGFGYTWLWPDGAVTYAAHYPIGYPAMLGGAYAIFGKSTVVAMLVNTLFGVLGALAVHAILTEATSRRRAFWGAVVFALHPALLFYTPAVMTEGVTASLLAAGTACAMRARSGPERARWAWLLGTGLVLGLATLVRPQSIVLAPVLGGLSCWSARNVSWRRRVGSAVTVLAIALLSCAPWTVRNCVRMNRCALVSVNGGWNLAIGAQTPNGAWSSLEVPEPCKNVFAEAEKDACFGREAQSEILSHPVRWLARVPAKLRVTFDYFGAAPWYLRESNPEKFPYRSKVALGTLETIVSRLLLAAALVAVMKLRGPRVKARLVVCAVGVVTCFLAPGVLAYVACALGIALLGRAALEDLPLVVPTTLAVIVATAVTHAVFFGAGRYGLVVVPFVTALAFVRVPPSKAVESSL